MLMYIWPGLRDEGFAELVLISLSGIVIVAALWEWLKNR